MNVKNRWMSCALLVGALLGGCKQGRGERCQVEADCESGLVCNQATMTCQDSAGTGIDANLPVDAAIDAPPDTM